MNLLSGARKNWALPCERGDGSPPDARRIGGLLPNERRGGDDAGRIHRPHRLVRADPADRNRFRPRWADIRGREERSDQGVRQPSRGATHGVRRSPGSRLRLLRPGTARPRDRPRSVNPATITSMCSTHTMRRPVGLHRYGTTNVRRRPARIPMGASSRSSCRGSRVSPDGSAVPNSESSGRLGASSLRTTPRDHLPFAPDGTLYVSVGDGAAFTDVDYGQYGGTLAGTPIPANPCGDPPGRSGTALTSPTARGGARRVSSLPAVGEPLSLDGAVLRFNPATGVGVPGNPTYSSSNPRSNVSRIYVYGFRNPFRFAYRSRQRRSVGRRCGLAHVGGNRPVTEAAYHCRFQFRVAVLRGRRQASRLRAPRPLRGVVRRHDAPRRPSPYYTYNHSSASSERATPARPGGRRSRVSPSRTARAIRARTAGAVLRRLRPQLHLGHVRGHERVARPVHDPNLRRRFGQSLSRRPRGRSAVRRSVLRQHRVGRFTASSTGATNLRPPKRLPRPPTAPRPSPSSSTPANPPIPTPGDKITYSWDLNGDGTFGDSTAVRPTYTYSAGRYTAVLRVSDSHGA